MLDEERKMGNRKKITRDVFLNALVCPRLGWLMRRGDLNESNTLAHRVNLEQEKRIKEKLRSLFPNGVAVSAKDLDAACKKTLALMSNADTKAIYDAAFAGSGYAGHADIIVREESAWHLYELKPAIQAKQEYLDDIAYAVMIMQDAGIRISSASLALLSKDYRLGMGDSQLFRIINFTKKAKSLARAFKVFMEPIDSLTSGLNQPKVNLIYECKNCASFPKCIGTTHEGHIFELPRLTEPKFRHLSKLQVRYVFDIPDEFPLTDRQKIALRCLETGKPFIGKCLGKKMRSIPLPYHYLDIEPVATPIPLYESIAPFERIPMSFSIHTCGRVGTVANHKEYISDPKRDCREEFTRQLVKQLEGKGSVLVYSGREKTLGNSLARAFPQYADKLNGVLDRFVDLGAIIRNEFYHPDFKGDTSMENIVSVLTHEAFPKRTDIYSEDDASAAFAAMALGKLGDSEMIEVRSSLSDYGRMKTLSLVHLHKSLSGFAD
jgi:hypothetical protein